MADGGTKAPGRVEWASLHFCGLPARLPVPPASDDVLDSHVGWKWWVSCGMQPVGRPWTGLFRMLSGRCEKHPFCERACAGTMKERAAVVVDWDVGLFGTWIMSRARTCIFNLPGRQRGGEILDAIQQSGKRWCRATACSREERDGL